jgi:hypothetical protein
VDPGAVVTRRVRVVSLDAATDALVNRLASGTWNSVTFVSHAGVAERAADDVAAADLVVMVASAGADAGAAARIGQACSDMRTHTATFVLRTPTATDEMLSRTLAQVRPWSLMVVVANDEAYVEEVLRSFR